jgi:hypothetical protein
VFYNISNFSSNTYQNEPIIFLYPNCSINLSFDVQDQRIHQKLMFNFVVKPSFDNIHGW